MNPRITPKGRLTAWSRCIATAGRLRPADAWRNEVARATRDALGATFVTVHTCPPGDLSALQVDTDPGEYDTLIGTLRQRFLGRIEAAGEGWRHGLARAGPVHAPLDHASDPELRAEFSECLAQADLNGYLMMLLQDARGELLGMIIAGTEAASRDVLQRHGTAMKRLTTQASQTLDGALALARACAPPPRAAPTMPLPATSMGIRSASAWPLTARELEVAALIAEGYSALNAAARLGLSVNTVNVHARQIYRKLGVHTRVELANLMRS